MSWLQHLLPKVSDFLNPYAVHEDETIDPLATEIREDTLTKPRGNSAVFTSVDDSIDGSQILLTQKTKKFPFRSRALQLKAHQSLSKPVNQKFPGKCLS